MAITGGCLCGGVRYEIKGSFNLAGNCHCSMCRRQHGAAFATYGGVAPEDFSWVAGEELLSAYESSPDNKRHFCRKCGSNLAGSNAEGVNFVTLGTVDGDPGIRPQAHIFVGSKASWYEISDSLMQFDEFPPGMG